MDEFIGNVNRLIINPIIVFLFALAIVFFLYGILEFILNLDNEEKRTAGKQHMVWGVIGLTIMMSVFWILNLIIDTFGIKDINPQDVREIHLR